MQGTQYASLSHSHCTLRRYSTALLLHFITSSPTYLPKVHNSYNRFLFFSFLLISFSFSTPPGTSRPLFSFLLSFPYKLGRKVGR